MNNWMQGLKDGEQWFMFQQSVGRTIDQMQAVNIVRVLRNCNTTATADYWIGYLDGLEHHIKVGVDNE